MIELNIPGRGTLQLEHLVSDVNGTLALDGQLLEGLPRLIHNLRDRLTIHLITADTHGRQLLIDQQLGLKAVRLSPGEEASQKAEYVRRLGAGGVIFGDGTWPCVSASAGPPARPVRAWPARERRPGPSSRSASPSPR